MNEAVPATLPLVTASFSLGPAAGQRPRRLLAAGAAGLWRGAEAAGGAAAMRPTLPTTTASVVCRRVPPRDAKPLRELGRHHGYGAGRLESK